MKAPAVCFFVSVLRLEGGDFPAAREAPALYTRYIKCLIPGLELHINRETWDVGTWEHNRDGITSGFSDPE